MIEDLDPDACRLRVMTSAERAEAQRIARYEQMQRDWYEANRETTSADDDADCM